MWEYIHRGVNQILKYAGASSAGKFWTDWALSLIG